MEDPEIEFTFGHFPRRTGTLSRGIAAVGFFLGLLANTLFEVVCEEIPVLFPERRRKPIQLNLTVEIE